MSISLVVVNRNLPTSNTMAHITSWHYGNAIALLVSLAPGALSLNTFPDCSSGPLSKLAVCDTSLDVTTRAQSLVNAMTFEEKVNNTQYNSPGVQPSTTT